MGNTILHYWGKGREMSSDVNLLSALLGHGADANALDKVSLSI